MILFYFLYKEKNMKKLLFTFLSSTIMFSSFTTISFANNDDNNQDEQIEMWDNSKIVTTDIGIMSGKTIKNMRQSLDSYTHENKNKIDRELEKTNQKKQDSETE